MLRSFSTTAKPCSVHCLSTPGASQRWRPSPPITPSRCRMPSGSKRAGPNHGHDNLGIMGMFKSESLGSFVGISTGEPMTTTELTDTQESGAYLSAAPHKLRIDVHAHIYPPEYLDLLDNMGGGGTGTHIARVL